MRHGQEGVELGSDAEVKWAAHLLQISDEYLHKTLTTRVTETRAERLFTPLGIDQALDSRDAFAKVLYSGLFNWYASFWKLHYKLFHIIRSLYTIKFL